MAKATLLYHDKAVYADGSIVEMLIWRLPKASRDRPHQLKYSLYYGQGGERIIGYDNETGKGDHRHYRAREEPYLFETPEKLIADFIGDVARERGET
jgi:Family of unknown function (DUF6516)